MSEDEAIKIILDDKKEYERIIKELDDVRDANGTKPNETIQDCRKSVQAIKTILDLYNKEKEKNKELEVQLLEKDLYIDGIKEDRRIAIEEIQEQYFISKDKIRAKIENLEKRYENEKGALGLRYSESGFINGKINVLKELLEEK